MALSPDIHSLFEGVPLSRIKRILAGQPVRLILMEGELFILARNCEQMILVEPRIRPGGDLVITYGLRDDVALADYVGRLGCRGKEPPHGYRRAKPRRLGPAGSVA